MCGASTAFGTSFSKNRIAAGLIAGTAGVLLAGLPQQARALNLYDGHATGNGIEVNLDTTLSWTGITRTNNPSKVLTSNINGDDGDLNFAHGVVSDEFEGTSILDITDGDYGAHFSGDAYLNTSYLGTNQNHSDTTNPVTIAKSNDFTSATRNINGLNAQVLDAFVYGSEHFGSNNGQAFTFKIGRQTLLWGQSLLLANNGLAAGQSPYDLQTADNNPGALLNTIIMPLGAAVATYSPNSTVTLQGYYQFQWQPDLEEGVGAYFSTLDILDKGGQRLLIAPGVGILRAKDIRPGNNNGQFGAALQLSLGEYDLGFYGIRYDSKSPTLYLSPAGTYTAVYPRDIWAEAIGLSTDVGQVNVAGETSMRQHMNLVSGATITTSQNANSDPAYPVGDTWAGQVSAIYISPSIPFDPGGVQITSEIGFNHLLKVTENYDARSQGRTGTAADVALNITPNYYDVYPNLNISFPLTLSYNLFGRSAIDQGENHGTGNFSIGISATYKVVYVASLIFDDHIGAANSVLNPSADRNYVLANLQYSF